MVPTPSELRDLLATILEGAAGKTHAHWVKAIGPVVKLPLAFNARCNWKIDPIAKGGDLHAIQRAVEIVREEHPYVAG